jgi:hypothetical protein
MKLRPVPKSEFEGRMLVEFVDEFGTYSLGTWTQSSVDSLGKPPGPKCGDCCHPADHEERKTFKILGKITGGKVYGDEHKGTPIERWFPHAVEG